MKYLLLLVVFFPICVYAGNPHKPNSSIAVSGAIAGAHANAHAGALAGSSSKAYGGKAYGGAGGNANNSLTVNVQSPQGESRILPNGPISASGGRGGQGGQGGAATASTGDSNSDQQQQQKQDTDQANQQTVNAGPEGNVNDTYEDFVSAAYAPSVQPTVPCLLPLNGGIVLPALGSLSAGSGTIDVECERRETVRIGLGSANAETRRMANNLLQQMLSKMYAETIEEEPEVSFEGITQKKSNSYDYLSGLGEE